MVAGHATRRMRGDCRVPERAKKKISRAAQRSAAARVTRNSAGISLGDVGVPAYDTDQLEFPRINNGPVVARDCIS